MYANMLRVLLQQRKRGVTEGTLKIRWQKYVHNHNKYKPIKPPIKRQTKVSITKWDAECFVQYDVYIKL